MHDRFVVLQEWLRVKSAPVVPAALEETPTDQQHELDTGAYVRRFRASIAEALESDAETSRESMERMMAYADALLEACP